ncbi:yjeF C-terminal region, hydroxyethylthiazole kinase-related/yjeF N-terminal region [Nitrosomonas eutropha]|uniref:Bifunctional NAD(P)H-hydrate repair enzyme n=1 Tax=Nitrosomonas eutropha TaxID=916 RepID=A0A1I7IJ30_9PROT|nr:bifunctional ADP-dependent NAD(P)H-hydrate dehydratase/NAD(P)H-hydrate epimerase [Nitrosomonas eutropha]SFU72929.1 yjeF C-terminal region, hydroxyethylthiazole kinase-related/yjeF N-terminal region [Nitrosomonas eutropha]
MNSTLVCTTAEIREIESLVLSIPNPPPLMEKAGLAAAEIAKTRLLAGNHHRILILAGPGNNGGDALVVARHLHGWGKQVTLIFTGEPERLSQDARQALKQWQSTGETIHQDIPDGQWDAVIDGLFGIGLNETRPPEEKYQQLINQINQLSLPVLALDIPSGLLSDSGRVLEVAVRAAITVTFIALKPGLLTHDGCDYCGEIIVCDLELDTVALIAPHNWLLDKASITPRLPPPRRANSHKGTYGRLGILGGASGMIGAALLAGRAALNLGAGRVYLGLLTQEGVPVVDPTQPELMLRPPSDFFELDFLDCLVIGPGLGREIAACIYLEQALQTSLPLVLDADALNLIAAYTELSDSLKVRKASTILTPHPAEAARLLSTSTVKIQHNRLEAAQTIVRQFNCAVVLKGAGSICAFPDGHCHFNISGNPGLSTAGTGDVLSGFLGALLVQGLSPKNALLLAVHLHGAAADALLEQQHGPVGMTASEIIPAARHLLNCWIDQKNSGYRYTRFGGRFKSNS